MMDFGYPFQHYPLQAVSWDSNAELEFLNHWVQGKNDKQRIMKD